MKFAFFSPSTPNLAARRAPVVFIVVAIVVAALAGDTIVREEKASAAVPPPQTNRESAKGRQDLETARAWMLTGRPRTALNRFERSWQTGELANWSRGRLALYIGLCYQELDDDARAKTWLQLADERGIPEFADDGQDLLASINFDNVPLQTNSQFRFVALAPNAAAESDGQAERLQQAVAQLRTAHKQLDNSKLETKVRYASWLLMVAEITSKWEGLGLSSTSVHAFAVGKKLLSTIAAELDANPALQKELDQNPALAVRFDAAQARLNVLNEREGAAIARERTRLNQLRSIAKSYRAAIESLGIAETNLLFGNVQDLRVSQEAVLKALQNVDDVAKSRKDLYLFSDEPSLSGDADFNVLKIAPQPYSSNLVSFHKALRAFSLLRAADEKAATYEAALAEAHQGATAARQLDESLPETLRAFDEKNILAAYVQALTSDELGLIAAKSSNATKRAGAAQLFARSQLELKQLLNLFAGHESDPRFGQLRPLVDVLMSRLSSADTTQRLASKLIDAGQPADARKELLNGALRHNSDELAVSYLQLGRRLGIPIDQDEAQVSQLRASGLLTPTSAVAVLEASRITLAKVGSSLASSGVPIPPSANADALRRTLDSQERQLRDVLKGDVKQPLQAQLNSELALALAYSTACGGNSSAEAQRIHETVQLAQNAAAILEASLKDGTISNNQKESYRECLIDARMALGYAAIIGLPNYHDESMLAFMSAMDMAVQGRNASMSLGLLGSPLLRSITARTGSSDAKLAAEERMRRQLMTRFVEGAFTLQFGQPQAAARQFADALAASNKSGAAAGSVQAEGALHDSDAFDAEAVLLDNVQSFGILSEVRAGLPENALVHALGLVGQSPIDSSNLAAGVSRLAQDDYSKVRRLQSPLSSVAVALAAETYAASIPIDRQDQALLRAQVLKLAMAASNQATQLLASPRVSQRYGQLASLAASIQQRLQSADFYLASIKEQMSAGRVNNAVELCDQGLRRHPNAAALWQEFVRLKSIMISQNALSASELQALLVAVDRAATTNGVSDYDRAYIAGLVHEKLNDSTKALASYDTAIARATNPRERVRALASASSLRARQPGATR